MRRHQWALVVKRPSEAVLSLQGLGASILGAIPYTAIRLGSYDGMKYTYKKVTPSCKFFL